jgi:hypothetical protein
MLRLSLRLTKEGLVNENCFELGEMVLLRMKSSLWAQLGNLSFEGQGIFAP